MQLANIMSITLKVKSINTFACFLH